MVLIPATFNVLEGLLSCLMMSFWFRYPGKYSTY